MKNIKNETPLTSAELFSLMRLVQTGEDINLLPPEVDFDTIYAKLNYQCLAKRNEKPPMSHDPNKMFVVSAISRTGVAIGLNAYMQDYGVSCFSHPSGANKLADDDDRLTDEICQEYADALDELDEEEDECGFQHDILEFLGFICVDNFED